MIKYFFEWDPVKAKTNSTKHRITFERATVVFRDKRAITIFDEEHSDEEERWITIGMDSNGISLVVVHTVNQMNQEHYKIRLISARKATKHEITQYTEEAYEKGI